MYFYSIVPLTTSPQVFNELLLQTSGLTKLKADEFIGDTATKQDIKQRFKEFTYKIKMFFSFLELQN